MKLDFIAPLLFFALVAMFGNFTGSNVAQLIKPEPVGLEVVKVDVIDGEFHQTVVPFGVDNLNAQWTAQIVRDGRWVCGGGDLAVYKKANAPLVMTPDVWAGSDCPDLAVGDVAFANWEWFDRDGTRKSVSARIEITRDMLGS